MIKSKKISRHVSNNGIVGSGNTTFFTRMRLKRPAIMMPFLNVSSRQNIYRTPKSTPIVNFKNKENIPVN